MKTLVFLLCLVSCTAFTQNYHYALDETKDQEAPSAPTNLVASNIGTTSVTLTWNAASDNISVVNYAIYNNDVFIANVGNVLTYNVTGLEHTTLYTITVRALDAADNESVNSNTATFTTLTPPDTERPSVPLNLVASNIGTTSVTLTWEAATDNIGVVSYAIYNNDVFVTNVGNVLSHTLNGLNHTTLYAITIRAFDAENNESNNSNIQSFTTLTPTDTQPPTAPLNLVVSNITETTVDLSWNAATDNVGVVSYAVYNNDTFIINTGNVTNFNLTGLNPATTYNLTLRALDIENNESTNSNLQSFTTLTPVDTENPSAPLNLVITDIGLDTAVLTWTAATDNVGVVDYRIYNNSTVLVNSTGNVLTYVLTGLNPATAYNITVTALDAENNESTRSNTGNFTTTNPPDTQNPSVPLNLVASNITETSVDLTWNAATDNVGVTEYRIYNNGIPITTPNITDNSHTLTGLAADTQYQITVKAFDAAGNNSLDSNTVDFATLSNQNTDCNIIAQPEVNAFETINGNLSASERYAHDYLVSRLKCENIWALLNDISTCVNNAHFKLKTSVTKNNISNGDTGVNLEVYDYNDISVTLDYNDNINTTNELLNSGGSKLRLLLNTNQDFKYTAFHCGNEIARISHDITMNTKRTLVLTSNTNEIAVATKNGYLIKKSNAGNIGTFNSETLNILDVNKLNFFAVGKGLTIEQSNVLADIIKEFNNLMARSNYDDEVGSYEFVGNSITFGFEPPSNKLNNNYPKLTSIDELGKTNATWNTSNLGRSGIRLDEVLAEIQNYDKNGLLVRNPNVETFVIVSLGTNDFLQGRTATDVKTDLDTYTSLLTSAGNRVLVILPHRTTTYINDNPTNYNIEVPKFINLVESDNRYKNGTLAYDTLVFETGNPTQDNTANSIYWYDGLHPKESYYRLMAPIIAPKLEPRNDNIAPSAPTNLTASNVNQSSATLSWTASIDNIGVVDYQIYNNGNLIINSTGGSVTNYTLTGLSPSTDYNITVLSKDAANNVSNVSNTASFTTDALTISDTYTLSEDKRISIGVYDANDNLLRTLVSNESKTAGTYNAPIWDGKDDKGNDVRAQGDYIKVVANNISAIWEGVIGNTSNSFTGETVHRHFLPFHDILTFNNDIYLTKDYTEAWGSVSKAALNNPNSRIDIMPNITVQQTTNRIATDGVRLYMAGLKSFEENISYVQAAKFADLKNFSKYEDFQGETLNIFAATFKATDIVNDPNKSRVTGLAVQTNGNWLVVAREGLNSVHIVHKTTGVLQQSLTYTSPKLCAMDADDNLWMVVNNEIIKYTIDPSSGTLSSTGFKITGFQSVQGMTLNKNSTLVAVADIDSNGDHRIFEHNTSTGNLVSTLGRAENYVDNPSVHNNKFLFRTKFDPLQTYIGLAYEDDNSIWVADRGNDRLLKFNASKMYQDQVMFMPAVYRTSVDPNNISRVFAAHREFEVDYNLPLQAGNTNGAWRYKNNWIETMSNNSNSSIKDITTLSNGRTYGLLTLSSTYEFVELDENSGLRETGVEITRWSFGSLKADGTYHRVINTGTSGTQELIFSNITFDSNNNPIIGNEIKWNSFPISDNLRMAGPQGDAGEITENGVYVIFNGKQEGGFHLGGIKKGDSRLRFKTSPGVVYNAGDPYPANGEYDLRSGVQYGGNLGLAIDNFIIWGYNGEFWEGGQTNQYNMYEDSGLFLVQFGEDSQNGNLGKAVAGMAGNAFSQKLVKYGNSIYMWHQDESYHAGLHRWKINNLDSVEEFRININ